MARTVKAVKEAPIVQAKVEVAKAAPTTPKLPVWRYNGGGILSLGNGKSVEMNEIFSCAKKDIPAPFLDLMTLVEGVEEVYVPEFTEDEILDVEIVEREDGNYDVVAGTNALNEEPLSLKEAKVFLKTLDSPNEEEELVVKTLDRK